MIAPAINPRIAAKMTFSTATRLTGKGASKRSSISRAKPRSSTSGKVTPCRAVVTTVSATIPGNRMAAKPGRAKPMLGNTLPKMKRKNRGCNNTCIRKTINSRPVTTISRRRIARKAVAAIARRLVERFTFGSPGKVVELVVVVVFISAGSSRSGR